MVNTYDAIVIGSGITGGWAAKELCESGLKTLVLERGRNVEHNRDYPTATKHPWELEHRNVLTKKLKDKNPIASRCYAYSEGTRHFFSPDDEHPYVQVKPFDWVKGYQVGGKSLIWGRWTQRWSDLDFEANAREGISIDWPIRYRDLEDWYSYVERFTGISGNRDGIAHIPDGEFQPPMEMNCVELHLKDVIESRYVNRHLIISRTANLTRGLKDRGPCQYRNLCSRGCPFAAYFSSNSATLPAARATGNLTLKADSVVHSLIFDDKKNKCTGVNVINTTTGKTEQYFARIIFVNAGTFNTTLVLLNSVCRRFPNGFGNDSGVLGHYLMDHNYRGHIEAEHGGFTDKYYFGRRPTGVYIPRYRNVGNDRRDDYKRGFAFAAGASRRTGTGDDPPPGVSLKEALSTPGPWDLWMTGMGECLPYHENKVTLSKTKQDRWGMPLLEIDCEFKTNELAMLKDMLTSGAEMLEAAGFRNINAYDSHEAPGQGIHEMGTARMGRSASDSILNEHNQVWAARNVFVTDGACMTSGGCQNPSLTYMALTARAAAFAVSELKKGNL